MIDTKRLFDLSVGIAALVLSAPVQALVAVLVKATSTGPVIYRSDRVGADNELFSMAKFRTMRTDTPAVATHLLDDADSWLTPVGPVLRGLSLDELPQLWHVVSGKMSLVGPRPALFNQDDLIELRTRCGVHRLRPGITGLAQIRGRDELSIPEKVSLDLEYLRSRSLVMDVGLLIRTVAPVVTGRSISR